MTKRLTEVPADPNIDPKRYSHFWFRFFEILPGATVWVALVSPFVLSFYVPIVVTLFIILFDIYWLIRSLNYGVNLFIAYSKMRRNLATDWQAQLGLLDALGKKERATMDVLDWNSVYNVVIIPTYKEEQAILEASIDSIVATTYPKERMIVVLATEGRDAENVRVIAANLLKKYNDIFYRFIVTEHPDGIMGEVKAKGANAGWAAKILTQEIKELGIPFEHVLVSTADADTRFPKEFFSALTYSYCTAIDRVHACFQPVATFFNNIWDAPILSRIMAFSTTFWQLIESIRDYRLITFSTHAMSLRTLVDIDYWCTSVVNEDSRQFFRAYFHYKGQFRVIPLLLPIYMDAVYVQSYAGTFRNLYYQQQRWAYGVEHFPYIVLESARQKTIPLASRISLIWRAYEGAFSWSTASFFITFVGWLPILLNPTFRDYVVASNFPLVTQLLLKITWVGLFVSSYITLMLVPPRPGGRRLIDSVTMVLQWFLTPISAIFFGAIPGLDAQTRLMFGKYLGFRVTEKKASQQPAVAHDVS